MADEEMSTAAFRIAFDGEALASHTMDVRDLAPSLLGLGEVLVEANKLLNGKDVKIDIRVTPNIEEQCFDIGLEVHQHWEAIKRLLGTDDAVAAQALVGWVLFGTTMFGGSVLWLYRKLKGKKPVNVIRFNDENGNPLYRYQFDGDDDLILDEKLHILYQSDRIRSQLGRLLRPLAQRPGIDEFTAYEPGKKEAGTTITKAEAAGIDFTPQETEQVEFTDPDEPIKATLRVYSPVYDLNAPKWRFWFGKNHHYMDVSESNIRRVVLDNGGALIEDRFRVRLQRTLHETDTGEEAEEFKVLEVLEFIPAYRQTNLFSENHDADNAEEGNTTEEN